MLLYMPTVFRPNGCTLYKEYFIFNKSSKQHLSRDEKDITLVLATLSNC